MKKILFIFSMLLAMGLTSACSTDDEIKAESEMLNPGDSVLVYAVNDKEVTRI